MGTVFQNSNILIFGASSALALAMIQDLIKTKLTSQIWVVSSHVSKLSQLQLGPSEKFPICIIESKWEDWSFTSQLLTSKLEGIVFDEVYIFCGLQGDSRSGSYGYLTEENARLVFLANVFLPSKILEFLSEGLLQAKSKIFVLSSRAGSISDRGKLPHHSPGGNAIYRASKAALNMMIKCFAFDHQSGPYVYIIHPGFVASESNVASNATPPSKFAAQMRELVGEIQSYKTGAFIDLSTKSLLNP